MKEIVMTLQAVHVLDDAIGVARAAGIDADRPSAELYSFVARRLAEQVVELQRGACAGFSRRRPAFAVLPPKRPPPRAID